MQLFTCWKSLQPVVLMEKHVENEMDGVSLDTVLGVMHEMQRRKCKCTFERIYAAFRQQHKSISRHALVTLLETAVIEKVVGKRVANNISSYQVLESAEYIGQKSAPGEGPSSILSQLSDAVISTLAAEVNTDHNRSLSLKSVEEKIRSEGKIRVSEDFEWSQNMRLVCKKLVARGILQCQGASYQLGLLDTGNKGLNASSRGSEVSSEQAGVTRRQKRNGVGFCKSAKDDDKDEGQSLSGDYKLASNDYRVIGEVLTSEMPRRKKRVCDAVEKAVVKQKTRCLLRHARGVSLKRTSGQKPGTVSGRKNLHHKKYQLRSSVERAADVANKPFSHPRKLLKEHKQNKLCCKQSNIEGQVCTAGVKVATTQKSANKSYTFSTEKFKQSSENTCQNADIAVQPNKSYSDGERCRMVARKSTRSRGSSRNSVQAAENAVATSLVDSLVSVGQPVVNLYRVESQPVENHKRAIPVDDSYNASAENSGGRDPNSSGGVVANMTKIPFHQLASGSEIHGNRSNEVKNVTLTFRQ